MSVVYNSKDQVYLDMVYLYVTESLSLRCFDGPLDPRLKISIDDTLEHIRFMYHGYLCGKNFDPVKFAWPEDWWQAFRARWFPGWWLKRHPVRNTVHTVNFRQMYPDFDPQLPRERQIIKCAITGLPDTDVNIDGGGA